VACSDVTLAPEVLPGASAAPLALPMRKVLLPSEALLDVVRAFGPMGRFVVAYFALPGFALWVLAVLYRWSIKGTALFLFPLAFYTADAPRRRSVKSRLARLLRDDATHGCSIMNS
jgi:hypothetical protein